VDRDEQRRAGIDGEARATETEHVREAVGQQAALQPGDGVLGDGLVAVPVSEGGVVVGDGADEDTRAAPPQLGGDRPGLLQRFPGRLQQEALLGVHHPGTSWW
jgi:hypothetical protein